jgi:universal stress protein A
MRNVRTILCPVDFTEPSKRELALAADLANMFNAELVLQHNLPCGAGMGVMWLHEQEQRNKDLAREKQAREQLVSTLESVRGPARERTRAALTYGGLDHNVRHLATHVNADLIVIGTHGRSDAAHPSETERLITEAPCPVLTTRDGAPEAWLPQLASDDHVRAVVPIDFTEHSTRALEYAIDVAAQLPLQVVALHVTPRADHGKAWAAEQLAKGVPSASKRQSVILEVKRATDAGMAHDIVEEQNRLGARLLIMGAHPRGLLEALFSVGRATAPQVLHASLCPVWFVPASAHV